MPQRERETFSKKRVFHWESVNFSFLIYADSQPPFRAREIRKDMNAIGKGTGTEILDGEKDVLLSGINPSSRHYEREETRFLCLDRGEDG